MEANTRQRPVRIVVVTGPQEPTKVDTNMTDDSSFKSSRTNMTERDNVRSHSMRRSRWPFRPPERPTVDTSLETASLSSDEACARDIPSTAWRLLQNDCFPDFNDDDDDDDQDYRDDDTEHSILDTTMSGGSTNSRRYYKDDDDKSEQRRRSMRRLQNASMRQSRSRQSARAQRSQESPSLIWWQNTLQDIREILHDANDALYQVIHAFELPEQDLSCVSQSIQSTRRQLKRTQRFFSSK
jgi:hypothetical protein